MLKLSQLAFFCAVVEEGTVASAALKSNCVPSNITIRIKELEYMLGVDLFVREKSRLSVSPEGRILYNKAKVLLSMARSTMELFDPASLRGVLNVGALDAALINQMPRVIVLCRQQMPDVIMNIRPGHSFELERQLVDGQLDLIITDGPIKHPLLASTLIFRERLKLVTPMHIKSASAEVLEKLELYVFGKNCFYRQQVDSWIAKNGITPRLIMEIESYPIMFSCIENGFGMACIPESFLGKAGALEKCHVHASIDLDQSDLYLVWRKESKSAAIVKFIEVVEAAIGSSI